MKIIKTMKTSSTYLVVISTILISCSTDQKNNSENSNIISDDLHFAFKTPDWERKINCQDLDFFPEKVNDSTSMIYAESLSTKVTFYFTYPRDSSKIVKTNFLKKHKIMTPRANNEPFQFSQKLPIDATTQDYMNKLISLEGISETEYNQISEIKYLKSEIDYALFKIKCNYEMNAYSNLSPTIIKPITGNFTFIIRTTKK